MSKTPVRLALDPDRCDRCGRCIEVCEPGALKVGASYIYVDWRACSECYKCVKACDRGAIARRESARATSGARATSKASPANRTKRSKATKTAKPAASASVSQGPWTLLEAGALLAVMLAAFIMKDAAVNSASVREMSPSSAVLARMFILALFYGVQVGTLVLLLRRRGLTLTQAFPLGRLSTSVGSKLLSAGLVIALLVGTRVATWIYGVVAQGLGWDPPELLGATLTDLFGPDAFGLVLATVMVVIVGPFIEEIVFRGTLLEAFESRMPAAAALVAQALLFGLYHFTPWMFLPTFMLGLATGWIARSRDSLWPAIILHALYNAVPVGIAFWLVTQG